MSWQKTVVTDVNQIDILANLSIEYDKFYSLAIILFIGLWSGRLREIIQSGELGTIIYASFISCFKSGEVHSHGWRASAQLSSEEL